MTKALDKAIEEIENAKKKLDESERKRVEDEEKEIKEANTLRDKLANAFKGNGAGVALAKSYGKILEGLLNEGIDFPSNPYIENKRSHINP